MNAEIRFLAQHLLHKGTGPLSERDRRVIARVARRVHVARNLNEEFDERLTWGERTAERVAAVGGSWSFILGCLVFLAGWAVVNAAILAEHAFDPYPFVFLNLLLSIVAALQAPLILMAQGRQAAKDRMAAALDYEVNVKSETAIGELHDKIDALQATVERLVAMQSPAEQRPSLKAV